MQILFAFGEWAWAIIVRSFSRSVTKTTLRVMKLTAIIICAACLQVSASGFSQSLTLKFNDAPLQTVLRQIEKKTNYSFIYGKGLMEKAKPVSIDVAAMPIDKILELIFKDQRLGYKISGEHVIISYKTAPGSNPGLDGEGFNPRPFLDPPPIKISGTVVGINNQPLAGATIRIKGKNVSTTSSESGYFELNTEAGSTLVISYVGHQQREYKVFNSNPISIQLNQMQNNLDTAQVVYSTGYQFIPKERATGSFAYVDNQIFNRRVGPGILDRLDMIVPGLIKVPDPGGSPLNSYQIRGLSTINADKKPLLVVDNFIYDGDINNINPNDIDNITVLKDAAAASIWGAKAGNGVIVLSMKKGKYNRKINISVSSNTTIREKYDYTTMPSVPSKDMIEIDVKRFNEGYYDGMLADMSWYPAVPLVIEILNKKRLGLLSDKDADDAIRKLENTDLRAEINKYLTPRQIKQQHAINLSGGTDKYHFYSSVGYNTNTMENINEKQDVITLRFSNDWKPVKNLSIGSEMNWIMDASRSNYNLDFYNILYATPVYTPLADENGNALAIPYKYRLPYVDSVKFPGMLDWHYRPLDEAKNGNIKNQTNGMRVAGNLTYSFLKFFQFFAGYQWQKATTVNTDIRSLETFQTRDWINIYSTVDPITGSVVYPYPLGAVYSQRNSVVQSWNFTSRLQFNRIIGPHDFSAQIGFETRETRSENYFPGPEYGYDPYTNTFQTSLFGTWNTRPQNFTSIISPLVGTLQGTLERFRAYSSNLSYTYDGKYTITASGRADASNFFGVKTNDRIRPFWSTGILWNISRENFYYASWLPLLKLRLTYGYSGNVQAGASPFATAYYRTPGSFSPITLPYLNIVTPPNPNLKWERVKQINAGIDFSLKQQRLSGSVDIYMKNGLDLIGATLSAPSTGFVTYTGNTSSIETKGIDVGLNAINSIGDLKIRSLFNLGINTHKVTKYEVAIPTANAFPGLYSGASVPMIGRPLDKLYSYKWAGLDPVNGDARFFVDNKIVASEKRFESKLEDYVYHGRTVPTFEGSFINDFTWRNLTLTIGIRYRFKYYFTRESFNGYIMDGPIHIDYLQSWKKAEDEKITNVPAYGDPSISMAYDIYINSSALIERGDNIKLEDIKLTYYFANIMRKLPFTGAKVYLMCDNIGYIWKASSYDPETRNGMIPKRAARLISAGVNFNF